MNLVMIQTSCYIYINIIKINSGCLKCKNACSLAVSPIDQLLVQGIILFLCNTFFSVGWQRNIYLLLVKHTYGSQVNGLRTVSLIELESELFSLCLCCSSLSIGFIVRGCS